MKKIFVVFCCMISGMAFASCPSGFISISETGPYLSKTCGTGDALLDSVLECSSATTTPVCVASSSVPKTCSAGSYFEASTNTCVTCPVATIGGVTVGSTSPSENDLGITSCYVASGTSKTDVSGTWTLIGNCNYE